MKNNILFVCSANKQRSRTAEDYFSQHSNKNIQSAGTNHKICFKEGTVPLSEEMLQWADVVYVMENKHAKIIKDATSNKYFNKIVVLNIQDKYQYNDKALIELLKQKVKL